MVVVLLLFIVKILQDADCISSTTLSQRERISILRHEIKQEILNVSGNADVSQGDTSQEEEDYIQSQKIPISPIMDIEKVKEKRFTGLKTTTERMNIKNVSDSIVNIVQNDIQHGARNLSSLRSKNGTKLIKLKKKRNRKPLEIFYRRIYNKDLYNQPLEWIHCQDMVTPFLIGNKKDAEAPRRLSSKDTNVQRILQLLTVNTTAYGRDDIYSILFQISNLQLRLFQWDVTPLNLLFNVIIKEHRHTFGYLKAGIRELFREWRMDISNTTNLLKQSRIFRPPCVEISKADGSTKSQKNTKYTKQPSTTCSDDDDCND